MIVRSYSGSTMDAALEKVRGDLGKDALIIETRAVREPGLLGKRIGYEVVAAGDPASGVDVTKPATHLERELLSSLGRRSPAQPAVAPPSPTPATAAAGQADGLQRGGRSSTDIETELDAIRRQLSRLAAGLQTPTKHLGEELASQLQAVELPDELIAELDEAVASLGDRLPATKRGIFCQRYLARILDCPGGIDWHSDRHLLMVGPTGVGKTTTVAKLAGKLVLEQQRRIALLTLDTYRVGASEQLRTYADLLDVAFEVVRSPAELGEALERHASCDNILVDTAGRSPADSAKLHELRGFFRSAPSLKPLLTISATCGRAEFARVVERFSILPIEHVAITKLDEHAAPGRLVGCLRRHRLPVHYCTTGQEVPQDIEVAQADRLVADCFAHPVSSAA